MSDTSKTYPQPHCPNCGSSLRLVVGKNDWYCDTCQTFPKTSVEISKKRIMGTKEGSKKFWIYMIVVMLAVFGWFIFEGIIERDPFLKSFYLYSAIIVIVGTLGSLFLLKVILNKR